MYVLVVGVSLRSCAPRRLWSRGSAVLFSACFRPMFHPFSEGGQGGGAGAGSTGGGQTQEPSREMPAKLRKEGHWNGTQTPNSDGGWKRARVGGAPSRGCGGARPWVQVWEHLGGVCVPRAAGRGALCGRPFPGNWSDGVRGRV